MTINVCVGSSCHIKGSYRIIELMNEAIDKNNLREKVNLGAAFCLGKCTDGVSVKINDSVVCGVNESNFDEFFKTNILDVLNS